MKARLGVLVALLALAVVFWPDDGAATSPEPLPALGALGDDRAMELAPGRDSLVDPAGPAPRAEPLRAPDASLPFAAPTPSGPRVVSGRVVDDDGVPLAGARVYGSCSAGTIWVRSDDVGEFRLEFPAADDPRVRVSHTGYAGTRALDATLIQRELTVRLSPLVQLTVALRDARGEPGGGSVRAFDVAPEVDPWDAELHEVRSHWVRETRAVAADADGLAAFTLRAGEWCLVAAWRPDDLDGVTALEYPRSLDGSVRWATLRGPEAWLDLPLPARATLTGAVTPASSDIEVMLFGEDESRSPAQLLARLQAPLRASVRSAPSFPTPQAHARTWLDGAGEYAFHDVPAGDWLVMAQHHRLDRLAEAGVSLTGGEQRRLDLTFDDVRVSAVVRDTTTGRLVHGATLAIWREPDEPDGSVRPPRPAAAYAPELGELPMTRLEPSCDADGRHDLSDLAPGRYRIWAFQQDPPSWPTEARWLEVPFGQQAVTVELPVQPAAPMRIRVQGLTGGERGVAVRVHARSDQFVGADLVRDPLDPQGATWFTPAVPPGHHGVQVIDEQGRLGSYVDVEPRLGQDNVFTVDVQAWREW